MIRLTYIFLLFFSAYFSAWGSTDTISIVFDLDSTLIETIGYKQVSPEEYRKYQTHSRVTSEILNAAEYKFLDFKKTPHMDNPKFLDQIIETKEIIKGQHYLTYYRVADWAPELIDYLFNLKLDVEIYAFSGSSEWRNVQALGKINISNGKSFLDIIKGVFSSQHLTVVPKEEVFPDQKFSSRFKKDMSLINSDISNVVLVDDYFGFVPKHQSKHQLTLFGVNWHFEDFEDVEHFFQKHKTLRVPHNKLAHFVARNKLAYVQAVLEKAFQKYTQPDNKQGFAEIVFNLSRGSEQSIILLPEYQIKKRKEFKYLEKGLRYFKLKSHQCSSVFN